MNANQPLIIFASATQFYVYLALCLNSVLNVKVLVGTFNLGPCAGIICSCEIVTDFRFQLQKPDGEAETINSLHSLFRRSQFNRIKIKRDAENYTKLCLESFLSVRFPAISCHSTFDKQFAKLQMQKSIILQFASQQLSGNNCSSLHGKISTNFMK